MTQSYLLILLLIALFSDIECWLAGKDNLLCHNELLAQGEFLHHKLQVFV